MGDLRLFQELSQRDLDIAVTEFYLERATLDDVFRQITNGAEN